MTIIAVKITSEHSKTQGQTSWKGVKKRFLFNWVDLSAQCTSNGMPKLEIVQQPKFGTIRFRDEDVVIKQTARAALKHCIGRTLKGRAAYYTINPADRDRSGTDSMSVRIRFANSIIGQDDLQIDLAQRIATRTKIQRD